MLAQLVQNWRNDGYTRSDVEVWTISYLNAAPWATNYCDSSTESCFLDSENPSESAFSAWSTTKDYLFVIDRQGNVISQQNLADGPLNFAPNRDALDTLVRGAL